MWSFCDPLCLRMTWEMQLIVACGEDSEVCDGLKELDKKRYQMGVGSQLITKGYEVAGFCPGPKPPALMYQWAEDHNYAGFYPELSTLVHGCEHDAKDTEAAQKACATCMSALQFVFKPTVDCTTLKPQPKPKTAYFFEESLVPMPAQIPKRKPLQERCVKTQAYMSSQFSNMQQMFAQMICECVGCCGDAKKAGLCTYPTNVPIG